MKHLFRATALTLACLWTAPHGTAQDEPAQNRPTGATETQKLRAAIDSMAGRKTPAVALAVVRGDKVIFADATGTARIRKPSRKADKDSRFPLGTLSQVVADMLVERMVEAGELDLSKTVNSIVGFDVPTDRNIDGDPTLEDLVRGEVRTARYYNHLPHEALPAWPLEGALRDHLRLTTRGYGSQLKYAVIQRAAERAGKTEYGNLLRKHLAKPLGLSELVAGVHQKDPLKVDLHRSGNFGFPTIETKVHSNLHAKQATWLTAQDAGLIVKDLLRIARSADADQQPVSLTNFSGTTRRGHSGLASIGTLPGFRGRIELFPEDNLGIVLLASSEMRSARRLLDPVVEILLDDISDENDAQWNSAVGLGGGAGGRVSSQLDASMLGAWHCDLPIRDRIVPIKLTLRNPKSLILEIPGADKYSKRLWTCNPKDFKADLDDAAFPLRDDVVQEKCNLVLALSEDGKVLSGKMYLSSAYNGMEFQLRFVRKD